MTGFKQGASESPFDEDDETDDAEGHSGANTDDVETAPPSRGPESTKSPEYEGLEGGPQDATGGGDADDTSIPWVLERDNIKSGRTARQVHLQDETLTQEREFRGTVERILNESVELTDLREAALLVAMNHPDDVVEQLQEWGYDY